MIHCLLFGSVNTQILSLYYSTKDGAASAGPLSMKGDFPFLPGTDRRPMIVVKRPIPKSRKNSDLGYSVIRKAALATKVETN